MSPRISHFHLNCLESILWNANGAVVMNLRTIDETFDNRHHQQLVSVSCCCISEQRFIQPIRKAMNTFLLQFEQFNFLQYLRIAQSVADMANSLWVKRQCYGMGELRFKLHQPFIVRVIEFGDSSLIL